MNTNRTAQLFMITLSLLGFAGCEKKASEEIDYGTINESVYRNEYFGLDVKLPADWSVQDQEAQRRMMEAGSEMVSGGDKNMKAAMKASEQQTVNLLAVFQHPLGTPVPFNPSLMCMAERVRDMPGIGRGRDYLYHARSVMETGAVKFEFGKEITTETLDGVDFDVMHVSMPMPGGVVLQKYYATIMKGYALALIVSYGTTGQEAELQAILQGVSFD